MPQPMEQFPLKNTLYRINHDIWRGNREKTAKTSSPHPSLYSPSIDLNKRELRRVFPENVDWGLRNILCFLEIVPEFQI